MNEVYLPKTKNGPVFSFLKLNSHIIKLFEKLSEVNFRLKFKSLKN